MSSPKLWILPTFTRWNSSWREYGKCSQMWLLTATPLRASSDLMICVTSEAQPPQELAALLCFFMPPMVTTPASTAAQMSPLLTLLQEQICAEAGSAATPMPALSAPSPGATSNDSGRDGSAMLFSMSCNQVP